MADGGAQLVGRQVELGVFEQALAELEHGRSAAVEVVGEPGIGKTRMLAELASRADSRGHVVLSGAASELENDVPFSVFVDALDNYVRSLDPRHLQLLAESARAELATVLPSLAAHAVGREVALQHERYRSHRAVRELLELVASQQPLVLILDDVHWADPGSVELLSALIQRPPATGVLIAVGARPRQLPDRLSVTFARAQRIGSLIQLELGALTHAEAEVMLGEAAQGADRAGLYEQSGGNPFYLQQLARMLNVNAPSGGAPVHVAFAESRVPPSVVAALAEELGLLTLGARTMLEGAAVAGDPFEPELAAAAAALSETAELDAMDELLRLDLVRGTEMPRRFRFRHPLLRRAVYEATPGGWRLAAHGRSAEALAVIGASAVARAHHVEYSARRGDLSAVAVLREAGEAAAQRTPASSARWFAAAVRVLGDSGPAEDRAGLLTALASAQAATGQFAAARSALLEGMALLPEDAVAQRVALTAACAGIEQLLGRHEDAHARLEHALRTLPDPASPQAASLLISLALDAFYRLEHFESRDWGLRALEVARPLGDPPLIAAACAVVALACAFALAIEDAQRYRTEAAALIDAMPDTQLAIRLDAMAYLTGAELYLDHFDDSIAHGTRGLAVARATGQGELLPILTQALGSALLVRGQLTEAAELFDGSIEAARLSGNEQTLAWSLLNRAYVGVHLGELDTALPTVQESVDLTRHLDESLVSHWTNVILAVVRSQREEHARAVDLFARSAGGPGLPRVPGCWRANFLGVFTGSLLALGRRDEAAQAVADAEAIATATGLGMAHGWARRARADLALHAGYAAAAAEHALASVAACEGAGATVEAAMSRIVAGRALAENGEADDAATELENAVEVLELRGAVRSRQAAERELRKLGRTIHRRSTPATGLGVASLTGRELELAHLVVDRKTNPEIAALLFLSQKTVETHLTHIFRKVGVSSRVELARAVEGAEPSP